jgi:hypothetical protein
MLKKILRFLFVPMILLLVTGCAGGVPEILPTTPSAPPSNTPIPSSSCIVGIWEIVNKEEFLKALVPVGSFEVSQFGAASTNGSVAYRFDNSGVVTVEAVSFQGEIDIRDATSVAKLTIRMEGFASGRYKLEDSTLTFSKMIDSDMFFSAAYDGEEMMTDVKADGFLPLFVFPYQSAQIVCSEKNLTITFIDNPNISLPLIFIRRR